jgi:hypothetical protein
MSADRFTCAGCGRISDGAFGGGLWLLPKTKRAIIFLLCERCAISAERDPQAMGETMEARFMRPQGRA